MNSILLKLRRKFSKKKFKYGGYATAMTITLIIIVVLINVLVTTLDENFNLSLDLTANRVYSLTSQSEYILDNLDQDIYIYTLLNQGEDDLYIQELVNRYKSKSEHIHYENIDMVKNPGIVSYYENVKDVTLYSRSIIVSTSQDPKDSMQSFKLLGYNDIYSYDTTTGQSTLFTGEDAITGAIRYVLNPNIPKVWFLDGHGTESSLWGEMRGSIEGENYDTEALSLVTNPEDLEKGDILIVFAPTIDLSTDEREVLLDFALDGGKIFFMFEPSVISELPNFTAILSHFNLNFEEGVVVENINSMNNYVEYPINVVPDYERHAITNPMISQGIPIIIPYSVAIDIGTEQNGISVEALLTSSESTFMESIDEEFDYKKNDNAVEGPFTLALAITKDADKDADESKIIVSGSAAAFLQLSQMPTIGNEEFFLNAISWMNPAEEDFYIRGKSLQTSVLYFKSLGQIWLVIILVCVVIPLAAFATGLVIFLRRRHL